MKTIIRKERAVICRPTEDTHIHTPSNNKDLLDIAIMKNVGWKWKTEAKHEPSSDHFPVIINFQTKRGERQEIIKTTNWVKYRRNLNFDRTEIRNEQDLENAVKKFQEQIQQATNDATTTNWRVEKQELPEEIRKLIKEKNKAKKTYHRTPYSGEKETLNNLTNIVKEKLNEHKNQRWSGTLEKLSAEILSLCKMTKVFTMGKTKEKYHQYRPTVQKLWTTSRRWKS